MIKRQSYPDNIARLLTVVRRHFHLPDPATLFTVVGAMAGHLLTGPPIWLMLIGRAGAGGTSLLEMLDGCARVGGNEILAKRFNLVKADSFSPASLISGLGEQERRAWDQEQKAQMMEEAAEAVEAEEGKGESGGSASSGKRKKKAHRPPPPEKIGLLTEVGDEGVMEIQDFTTFLSVRPDVRNEIFGVMRKLFDGYYDRPLGTGHLFWKGRLSCLTKTTEAIDNADNMIAMAEMGQRFLMYRMPVEDDWVATQKVLDGPISKEVKEAMRDAMTTFMLDIVQNFNKYNKNSVLTQAEKNTLTAQATISARARGAVQRNHRGLVTNVLQPEASMRFVQSLYLLFAGLRLIGVPATDRMGIMEGIYIGSMPKLRGEIFRVIATNAPKALTTEEVGVLVEEGRGELGVRVAASALEMALEDLFLLRVLDKLNGAPGSKGKKGWALSALVTRTINRGSGQ